MKGQPFLAPGKVLLTLMRRCYWQVLKRACKSADELSEALCTLSSFVLEALRVSQRDVQRSLCYLMTEEGHILSAVAAVGTCCYTVTVAEL
eukprot:symbB.v1.2.006393.t1/scaffold358.1/size381540/16